MKPPATRPERTRIPARWREARRILAVRLDNLGDVLMTTPALAALRHSLPQARITLLGSPAAAAVAPHLADIDELMVFAAPWVKSGGAACPPPEDLATFARRLAAARFDAAIIFTVCTQSALPAAQLCLLAGIPLRLAHCRENPYALLSDWVPDPDRIDDDMRHEVARQLALVAAVGMQAPNQRLRFRFSHADLTALGQRLIAAGVDPARPYFVVHPGASAPSRRYPAEYFGRAAHAIALRGYQAIFTGSAEERPLIEQARAAMGSASASLGGQLSLGELGALIAGARVTLTNNSAPAHIAAALGTPVVDLYALTNPQHTPWMVPAQVLYERVPCRNCLRSVCPEAHHACLRNVLPERVAAAALELIEGRPAAPLMTSTPRLPSRLPRPALGTSGAFE